MSERLSDDLLTDVVEMRIDPRWADAIDMAEELRERRAADLSAEESNALAWLREWDSLDGHAPRSQAARVLHTQAIAALDKLLKGAKTR